MDYICQSCRKQLPVEEMNTVTNHEPSCTLHLTESSHDRMVRDIMVRRGDGYRTYGRLLTAAGPASRQNISNLWDAYEEVLDLAAYIRKEIDLRAGGSILQSSTGNDN